MGMQKKLVIFTTCAIVLSLFFGGISIAQAKSEKNNQKEENQERQKNRQEYKEEKKNEEVAKVPKKVQQAQAEIKPVEQKPEAEVPAVKPKENTPQTQPPVTTEPPITEPTPETNNNVTQPKQSGEAETPTPVVPAPTDQKTEVKDEKQVENKPVQQETKPIKKPEPIPAENPTREEKANTVSTSTKSTTTPVAGTTKPTPPKQTASITNAVIDPLTWVANSFKPNEYYVSTGTLRPITSFGLIGIALVTGISGIIIRKRDVLYQNQEPIYTGKHELAQ
jgi:FtsZ-interacting cell division protein ZipA